MNEQEKMYFQALTKKRAGIAESLEDFAMQGVKDSVVEKYSDQAHFIYELLQNADDAKAKYAKFVLQPERLIFSHNGERHFSISDPTKEREASIEGKLGDINSITAIGASNKTPASIGKFGVGFKAVFQYTSTKIIMRLPDQSDRELVGKAAGLNDDQIIELSKLPRGVAALYQNEWIQPVLCKIDKYSPSENNYKFDVGENESILEENSVAEKTLLDCIMDNELFQVGDREDLRELKSIILRSNL